MAELFDCRQRLLQAQGVIGVVKQKLLLVTQVNLLDFVHQTARQSMLLEIALQVVDQLDRHRSNCLIVNILDKLKHFNGVVSLLLSLLGQVESLFELRVVFVSELKR